MQADKTVVNSLLKTAKGQIDGILGMVEEDRYCIDISNQLLAAQSIIKKANKEVLKAHLKTCVADAIKSKDDKKIEEVFAIIDKL